MRVVGILGLLIILCASANAATVHHPRPRQATIVRPSAPRVAPPRVQFAVPGWSDEATKRWLDNASSSVGRGG